MGPCPGTSSGSHSRWCYAELSASPGSPPAPTGLLLFVAGCKLEQLAWGVLQTLGRALGLKCPSTPHWGFSPCQQPRVAFEKHFQVIQEQLLCSPWMQGTEQRPGGHIKPPLGVSFVEHRHEGGVDYRSSQTLG